MIKNAGLLSIAVSLLLFVGWGCPPSEKSLESHLTTAEKLYAGGQYQSAATEYRRALEIDAGSVVAWTGLAESGLKLGDINLAIDAYETIIAIDPAHAGAELKLAEFDLLAGKIDQAEQKVRLVLENDPGHIEALFVLANIAERNRQWAGAIALYEQIVDQSGQDKDNAVRALIGLAGILARQGALDEAAEGLSRAAVIDPGAMKPGLMLFNLHVARRDFQKAEQVLTDLIKLHVENIDLRLILGRFYYHQQEMDKAAEAFSRAVYIGRNNPAPLILAGKFHAATGRLDEALDMFEQALRIAPRNITILSLAAEFYLEHGYYRQAQKTIDAVLGQRPGHFPARLLQVRLAIAEKDYDRAITLGDRFLRSNPASADLMLLKGEAFLAKNDFRQAEKLLAAAVRAVPENIDARIMLADAYLRLGKVAQAQEINRETLALMHERSDIMVILGDGGLQPQAAARSPQSIEDLSRFVTAYPFGRLELESLGRLGNRFDQVIQSFEALILKNPTQVRVFESVVLLHVAKGEYDIALEKCVQQIERLENHPGPAAAVFNIKGGLLLSQGDCERASEAYETAISLAPDFLKPYYGLAKCYLAARNIDRAIGQYRAILERFPEQAAPYLLLGVLSRIKGDDAAAENYYRRALAVNPNFSQAANNLAYLLAEREEKLIEALDLALTAKSISPEDPYIRDTLGWVYYRKGLYEDAVRELSIAVNALPDNAVAHYHLGMAWYQAGDMDKAGQHLERSLMIDSDFPGVDQAEAALRSMKFREKSN